MPYSGGSKGSSKERGKTRDSQVPALPAENGKPLITQTATKRAQAFGGRRGKRSIAPEEFSFMSKELESLNQQWAVQKAQPQGRRLSILVKPKTMISRHLCSIPLLPSLIRIHHCQNFYSYDCPCLMQAAHYLLSCLRLKVKLSNLFRNLV